MPRKAKTQSGAPAQAVSAIPGQVYGMEQAGMDLQKAMPAPQLATTGPQPGSQPAAAVPPQGGQPAPTPQNFEQVLAQAQQMRSQTGLLTQPTNRPNEPITAGLPSGPGPGPEILGLVQGTPVGDAMRRLSQVTGDPSFAALARKAGA